MVQLVQAVENTEYINAIICSLIDEMTDHIFRIVGISYGIGAAGQHLEKNIRCSLPHLTESVPGAFIQETVSYVEGSAAPVFKGEKLRHMDSRIMDGLHNIMGPHAGSQQGLMGITVRGVHEHDFLAVQYPLGKLLRPQFIQKLSGSLRCFFLGSIQHRKRSKSGFPYGRAA